MITTTQNAAAERIQALYIAAGMPCEIEAIPAGLVVYASAKSITADVAAAIARGMTVGATKAVAGTVYVSSFEPAHTAHWCRVDFDWAAYEAATGVRS